MMYDAFSAYYDKLICEVDYPARAHYFNTLVHRFLSLPQNPILLDLACGTASLSIELQKLGYDVIGVDASAGMLAKAGMKAAGMGILFLQQKFWELDLYGTVDVTICALDSLNHISKSALLKKTFERVSLFTIPGGLFIFDVNTAYKHSTILKDNTFVYDFDDVYCVWQNETDERLRTKINLDFFIRKGEFYIRESEQFMERAWTHAYLSRLLDGTDFELLAVYAGDTDSPLEETTERAVYVARRKGQVPVNI